MTAPSKKCVITGTSGYVGSRLKAHLQNTGWQITDWNRRSEPGQAAVKFQLGQDVDPQMFTGVQALVHCAYDFKARRREEIVAANIRGSEKIFRAAKTAGVKQIVFISSVSAFTGCRSVYGQTKLEIESIAAAHGAVVIRPGLVYGNTAGGVFGGLVRQVKGSRFVPLLGDGSQAQYLVHDEDLGRLISRCISGEVQTTQPITLAHEQSWPMRHLLQHLAGSLGKKVTFIPLPWRLVWLGLKSLETAGLPSPFRSDSLIGLIYQNPAPSFEQMQSLHAKCRPFQVTPQMLA